jgi:hypothetical protein
VYTYRQDVLDGLASHGLIPRADTPPGQLRDAVRDLYRYEIRALRDRLIAGQFAKHEYAGRVILLRRRYWLLSVPLPLWLEPEAGPRLGESGI